MVKEGTCFKNPSKRPTNDFSFFMNLPKNKPLQIDHKNYKHLNESSFNGDPTLAFSNNDSQACAEFEVFMNLLDQHAPLTKII